MSQEHVSVGPGDRRLGRRCVTCIPISLKNMFSARRRGGGGGGGEEEEVLSECPWRSGLRARSAVSLRLQVPPNPPSKRHRRSPEKTQTQKPWAIQETPTL